MVDPKSLDLINYSVCRFLSEAYGKKRAEKVFRYAGKIIFSELKKRITFKKRLVKQTYSPSHCMTNIMFVALKELCGVRVDIVDSIIKVHKPEAGYVKERSRGERLAS